ncbi:MAG: cysteine-rich CWC family protein [Nitrospira sp.]|nr:cysteine-rich CWC family protein [Nitrospira sp.]
MRGPVQKICESCGCGFECGGYQCWCGKVGITESQMDWIASRYKDCLCPGCLGKVAAGELGPQLDSISKKQGDRASL